MRVPAAGDRPKSLPDLVATGAEKEGWPRVLHADAEKGAVRLKTAMRHRVKLALGHTRHRAAERKEAGQVDYTATADHRLTSSY